VNGRTLWIDPGFGASGDMLLGALVGLGADPDDLVRRLRGLGVDGWSITSGPTVRCGLSATRLEVHLDGDGGHRDDDDHDHGRRWSEIDALLAGADLPGRVRDGARSTFRLLGEVEAAAHDLGIDDVHFHEVGAVDAIVDIVGVWLALDLLGVDRVASGPVGLGHGTVRGAHGVLPLPAPATAALLAGAPVRHVDVEMETCTPTGAALLATIGEWGSMPPGTLVGSSRGAGGRDVATHPNVVALHLIDTAPALVGGPTADVAIVLATNLDDVTPEVVGHVVDRLLAAGADDAWATPIVMKKSRPGVLLEALVAPDRARVIRELISAETGTLGIRETQVTKHVQPRHVDTVDVDGRPVRIKVGPHGAKPEHDDLVALAAATGRPLRAVAAEAMRCWHAR
jgi:uncharacterized protein (TIGR00299 family) protein